MIKNEIPDPVAHFLQSNTLQEKMGESYDELLEILFENEIPLDVLINLLYEIGKIKKFYIISCRGGGVDIQKKINNQGLRRVNSKGETKRVKSRENEKENIGRTSSFYTPQTDENTLTTDQLLELNQVKHRNRYKFKENISGSNISKDNRVQSAGQRLAKKKTKKIYKSKI